MTKKQPQIQNAITLKKFFVTSVNFNVENPFDEQTIEKLNIKIAIKAGFGTEQINKFSINFDVFIKSKNNDFKIILNATGLFETTIKIDAEFKNSNFVKSSAPAIVFPFIRSYINTLTSSSGIPPLILPSFNFTK